MGDKVFYMMINLQNRSHGLVVRAATCEARRSGFNASSDEMFFSLLLNEVLKKYQRNS